MAFLRASAASLFATALLFASGASAAFQNDFSAYPSGAQSCLYKAADNSGCDGNTVAEMNACLCGNEKNGFVILAAKCLGPGSPDLETTYSIMNSACTYSKTPLAVSQAQWDAAASGSSTAPTKTATTSATTSAGRTTSTHLETITQSGVTLTTVITSTGQITETATSTSSSSPSQTSGGGGGGGGTNPALIGGIAGGVAAVLLAVIAVVYFVLRRRLNAATKARDESHPMLNNPGGSSSNGGSGGVPLAAGPGMFSGTNPHLNTPSPNLSTWGQTPTPTSPSMMGGAAVGAYSDDKGEWRPTSTAWTATPPPQPQVAAGWGATPGQPHGQWNPPQPYQGAGAPYQGAVELPPQTAPQMYELDNTGTYQRTAEMPGDMMPPQQR